MNRKSFLSGLFAGIAVTIVALVSLLGFKYLSSIQDHRSSWLRELGYSPDQDYKLPTNIQQSKSVQLVDNVFIWPELERFWDTVMLGIEIETGSSLLDQQPELVVSVGEEKVTHQFEFNSSGMRYLNLSRIAAILKKGMQVSVELNHASLRSTKASLITYSNPINFNRILIIAPHPDDSEISAGGIYQKYSANSWLVTVTDGGAGGNRYKHLFENPARAYQRKAELRTLDSIFVPLTLNVPENQLINLGYFDGSLQDMSREQGDAYSNSRREDDVNRLRMNPLSNGTVSSNWTSLVKDMSALLNHVRPTVIITPHVSLDTHPDHQYSTIALLQALSVMSDLNPMFLTYSNHVGTELYPFGWTENEVTVPFMTHSLTAGIFSFALNAEQKSNKLLALDMMHDLREKPHFSEGKGGLIENLARTWHEHARLDKSYFRRAVRPNELFFSMSKEEALTMIPMEMQLRDVQ